MTKILVTGVTDNIGGVETFIINYYRAMRIYGDIVLDVMCYTEHPAFEEELIKYGGKIIKIPSVRNPFTSRNAVDKYLKEHGKEYIALWCNKCDLFNIDFIKAAHKWGIPHIILHSHSSFNMYCGKKRLAVSFFHKLNKKSVEKYATDFWACSDYAAKWMFPKSLLESKKVQYIPNAVDARRFSFDALIRNKVRKDLCLENELIIGCIGRLSYVKNPIFTLSVFDEIQKRKSDARLLMIGAGELEDEAKEYARTLGCKEKIQFLGIRNDVPDLMQAMDCVLLPSHFEGLPVVAVEAQAAGLHIFAASDGITAQTKLTDFLHFMPLSDGPEKWAEEILNTSLERRDTFDEMVDAGFEITNEGKKLYNRFIHLEE